MYRLFCFALDVFINRFGSRFARAHRGNNGCCTGDRVAAGKDAFAAGLAFSSAMMPPHFWVSSPSVVDLISGFGEVPMDMTTQSTSITNSLPGTSTGRRRPEASGSPSSMRMHFMP